MMGSKEVRALPLANVSSRPRLEWWMIPLIYAYRLFLCSTIRTVEAPDEWWQSTEVAYNMVFGKGHLPWEWHYGLRSVVFPGIVAVPFFLLKSLSLDTTWAVWFAPRALQALVLTLIDICVFSIGSALDELLMRSEAENVKVLLARGTRKGFDYLSREEDPTGKRRRRKDVCSSVAYTAMFLSLSNWYMAYGGVRLYGNVAEALFVLLALQQRDYTVFLLVCGFASMIRVTSAVVLLPVAFYHLWKSVQKHGFLSGLCRVVFIGLLVLMTIVGGMMLLDYIFYGRWVLTPLAFFQFNVLHNLSRFFGEHPWYFYIGPVLVGIVGPHIIITLSAPFVLWRDAATRAVVPYVSGILGIAAWTVGFYSLISHKEMRFIFVVIPLSLIVAAVVLSRCRRTSRSLFRLHLIFVMFNVIMIYVMGYVYRRGPLDVMAEVRRGPTINRLHVIATCYTVPGYSYVHKKVNNLSFIDCSIQLDDKTGLPKLTEDIMFRRYPKDYVLWKYDGVHSFNMTVPGERLKAADLQSVVAPKSWPHPDMMVLTRAVAREIEEPFLKKHSYRLYRSFLHSPFTMVPYEDTHIEMWSKMNT
uniref:Mannosyltransferase n=1 Tax=Trypanosoma congolense (strain IL3000) TaxID=1068625 RepID=G0UWE0_TRYCI|nr:putative GPI anchor biosynthesis protein [Trypanosoma congolense IL3000]